jgi:hypothetical protein
MPGVANINNIKRIWRIPTLTVYGLGSTTELEFLAVEEVAGGSGVFFGRTPIGAAEQQVNFSDLIDANGNQLPSQINSAAVIVQSREEYGAFMIGNPASHGFRIARSSSAAGPVEVGLVIFET